MASPSPPPFPGIVVLPRRVQPLEVLLPGVDQEVPVGDDGAAFGGGGSGKKKQSKFSNYIVLVQGVS